MKRSLRILAVAASLTALAAGQALAQNDGVDRRFDRLERDVRTLQSIVQQAQATGQPVVVRPEGPDPAMTALQVRVTDLEMTLQRINGQMETLAHDLDGLRSAQTADADAARAQAQSINDRFARLEAQINTIGQVATASDPSLAEEAPAPPPAPEAGAAPPPRRPNTAATDATARAQAQDTGVLGGGRAGPAPPPPPPPPPPASASDVFIAARDRFTSGDQVGATAGFQDFIARYPTNARAPEAYYWLGESYYAQKGWQNATAAYASALRNRPTTSWAPAAMVRLAQALYQSNQAPQACAALTEFDQRYAARASAAVKSNADVVRRRARCG
jgi:tol-pal system protein YbgF